MGFFCFIILSARIEDMYYHAWLPLVILFKGLEFSTLDRVDGWIELWKFLQATFTLVIIDHCKRNYSE
jgi:hypothetical protein